MLICLLLSSASVSSAQTGGLAPGAPGNTAQWTNAGKNGVGTSVTLDSKVWFTLRDGVMTECYFPTVDVANTRSLQLVVVSSDRKRVEVEEEDTTHSLEVLDSRALSFRQINRAKSGAYTIRKTYTVDPARAVVLIDVQFQSSNNSPYFLYVYYDPSLNNSGMHDSAWTQGDALLASDADKATALLSSTGFEEMTNGYLGTSDGLRQLKQSGRITNAYVRAGDGNVVQVARVKSTASFTLALGFGREAAEALTNARAALSKGFAKARAEYEAGWREYVSTLRRVGERYRRQFDMAAMILKAHEDKTYRGAMIASLSIPWGGGENANEPNIGGYHLVWSRDLYQVATAFYALGDKAAADRALNYLFTVQQKPDGSFPQNSWLDGRPFWGSLQMDEVAFPLILAYQLGRTDGQTWVKNVKPAADFLLRFGPGSVQERWEEEGGYSPSTIAAEIAGLVCAAEIARRNNDEVSAGLYLAAADEWTRKVEDWTATKTGRYGDKSYYLRITENSDPNDGARLELNNGAGSFDEREIVDAGFLELVRLGIKPASDPLIAKSVAVIDSVIKVETPNGPSWYRYNHDGYGEKANGNGWDGTGTGRLWVLLNGERGQYELARGERSQAMRRLDELMAFANDGLMLPEQVWDRAESPRPDLRFGEGTGSATPLAWTMAQFIRLAVNLEEGRNLDTPELVASRYVKQPPPREALIQVKKEYRESQQGVGQMRVQLRVAPRSRAFIFHGRRTGELRVGSNGLIELEWRVGEGDTFIFVAVHSPGGATGLLRFDVRSTATE
ncbi:MAG TPA: glucan 1,4-alpha-glucosidase [Pyrinomonadaceae bacterium]|nr:glucan 1,4-alpha-glucosidase [Pyrinomonadaceae bacterium]